MNTFNALFDPFFWVHICSGLAIILVFWILLKTDLKRQRKEEQKLLSEMTHSEAEKLSKKLKDSRVEMGVRKPQVFKTKRKPQKKG